MEKRRTKTIANQKLGIAIPSWVNPIKDQSLKLPWLEAEKIPIGIAIRVDKKIAYNVSGIETPILAITNSETGTL